jgi:hypothetical protein
VDLLSLKNAIACVLLICLGACTAGPDGDGAKAPSPSGATASATTSAPDEVHVDRAAPLSGAARSEVGTVSAQVGAGPSAKYVFATELLVDGRIFGNAINSDQTETDIVEIDPKGASPRILVRDNERAPGTFVANSTRTSNFVVWSDSASSDAFSDPWTLRSKDVASGEVRVLAEAPPGPNGGVPTYFGGALAVHDGYVYLEGDAGTMNEQGVPDPSIYRVKIDGSGELQEYIKGGSAPQISDDVLMFRKNDRVVSRSLAERGDDTVIDSTLTSPRGQSWVFNEGTFAAAAEQEDGTFSISVQSAGRQIAKIAGLRVVPGRMRATSRWVAFAVGGGGDF